MKLQRDPTFAFEMLQHMSRRIRYLEEHLRKLMENELAANQEVAKILAKAEYRPRDEGTPSGGR